MLEFINVIHMWPRLRKRGADATLTLSIKNALKLKSRYQAPSKLNHPKGMQFINKMWRSLDSC